MTAGNRSCGHNGLLFVLVAVGNSETYGSYVASAVNVHITRNKFTVAYSAKLMEIVIDPYPCGAVVLAHIEALDSALLLGSSAYIDNIGVSVLFRLSKTHSVAEFKPRNK